MVHVKYQTLFVFLIQQQYLKMSSDAYFWRCLNGSNHLNALGNAANDIFKYFRKKVILILFAAVAFLGV